jgi:hypothetical protein
MNRRSSRRNPGSLETCLLLRLFAYFAWFAVSLPHDLSLRKTANQAKYANSPCRLIKSRMPRGGSRRDQRSTAEVWRTQRFFGSHRTGFPEPHRREGGTDAERFSGSIPRRGSAEVFRRPPQRETDAERFSGSRRRGNAKVFRRLTPRRRDGSQRKTEPQPITITITKYSQPAGNFNYCSAEMFSASHRREAMQRFSGVHRRGGTDTGVFQITPQRRDGHRGFSDRTAEAGRTAEGFRITP